MSCQNCFALRERVRVLERELGLRYRDGAIGALMHKLGLAPAMARIVLVLYEAKGRFVARDAIIEAALLGGYEVLSTQIKLIRDRIGDDAIVTTKGLGYALGVPGISQVLAVIEPPELQDVRG